jgi:hypothetical protein
LRITKPAIEKKESRNLRRERRRWDDAQNQPLPLGCLACVERATCGGIHKRQFDYDCLGDCCGEPATCDDVCPRDFDNYILRYREVNGFDLNNIPRATPCLPPDLPNYIPLIFHRNRREESLDVPAVALPFHRLYIKRDGSLRFKTRTEIEEAFRIGRKARIVLVGCGRDKPIEAWWGLSTQRRVILKALFDLGVELVTSPNYSVFTDVPRYDNMFNLKRIGVAWHESVDLGLPSALHLNGRTERDYERLVLFIQQRAEVTDVAFEFKTGGAWRSRRAFHHQQLAEVARKVSKPLRILMVGGFSAIPILAPAYAKLTFIDTSAFMKAMHRQRLIAGNDGNVLGVTESTSPGAPVDALLVRNIEVMRARVEYIINESRSRQSQTGILPMQEIPETDSSEQAGPVSGQAANY